MSRGTLSLAAAALLSGALASGAAWLGLATWERGTRALDRWRELEDFHREAARADTLAAQYARLDSALGGLGRGLPAGSEGGAALGILVAEAKACSLGIANLEAMEERDHGAYRELPFALKATGEFPRLVRFLQDLDSRPWALRLHAWEIRSVAIHKTAVTASLQFSVFAVKPGQASAP